MMMSERVKYNAYNQRYAQMYFWRTQQQQEVDLIEEHDGRLKAFEFKWHKPNAKLPKAFVDSYPDTPFQMVTPETYREFV